MDADIHCPKCRQPLTQVGTFWICPEHGQISPRSSRGSPRRSQAQAGDEAQTSSAPIAPLRIFLSCGHDANEALVRRIYSDLKERKHDVWFDQTENKFGDEWRRSITDGILQSNRVLSFLSKHSTRDPGVCLDEIAIAIGRKSSDDMTAQNSMARFRPVIRVFVSSTFSDPAIAGPERNALQAQVFPRLEQLCAQNGFQFQAIDLRHGKG